MHDLNYFTFRIGTVKQRMRNERVYGLFKFFFRKNNVMKFDDDIKFQLHAFRENKENEIQ